MTRRSLLVLAATVAALLAGCDSGETDTTLPTSKPEQPSSRPPPSGTLGVAEPPQPPAGTGFVGKGRIVVAVPKSWSTNDTRCGQPLSDTVVFDSDRRRLCHLPSQPFSSVHIVDTESKQGRDWLSATVVRRQKLDGVTVTRSGAVNDLLVNGHSRVILAAPEEGVAVMIAASTGREMFKIANSLHVLPEGYVTVPDVSRLTGTEAQRILQEASLKYRTTVHPPCPSGFSDCGFVVGATVPVAGSVVETGAIVTVKADPGLVAPQLSKLPCELGERVLTQMDQAAPDATTSLTQAVKRFVNLARGQYFHVVQRGGATARVIVLQDHVIRTPAHKADVVKRILTASRWSSGGWTIDLAVTCKKG